MTNKKGYCKVFNRYVTFSFKLYISIYNEIENIQIFFLYLSMKQSRNRKSIHCQLMPVERY